MKEFNGEYYFDNARDALKNNHKFYYTGEKCKNDHDNLRYAKTKRCIDCKRDQSRLRKEPYETVYCEECNKPWKTKLKKPCSDGVLRCGWCSQKRRSKLQVEKEKQMSENEKRDKYLYHKYKITLDDYERMKNNQNGVCAICHDLPENEVLEVDHDHTTGNVRGLLCSLCNRGIGHFKDDIKNFRKIISYFLKYDKDVSWDDYYIHIAETVSLKSKDPSSKVGAVIVKNNSIISTGYNGFPRGTNDSDEKRYDKNEKYFWTIHAEENAILNCTRNGISTEGATLYTTPLPTCINCAKSIVASGIKEVVNDRSSNRNDWDESNEAEEYMKKSGILVRSPDY